MTLAHLGLAVTLAGIAASAWQQERIDVMKPGEDLTIAGYVLHLAGVGKTDGPNFTADRADITVTKDGGDWQHLKPAILGAIMEHYMSGAPLLADGTAASDELSDEEDEFFDEADAETVEQIKDLIETRVRPAVANDGGDITFRGFKDGVVYLNMKGSCAGCPSSTATLQHGIQNLLRHFVPDVVEVRPM